MRPDNFPTSRIPSENSAPEANRLASLQLDPGTYVALNELVTVIQETQLVLGLDVEDLVIFLTVLTGNLQRWHRTTHLAARPALCATEMDFVPMSQSAISRATGMARETVRRRMRDLSRRGLLVVDSRGAVTANHAFAERLLTLPLFRRLRIAAEAAAQPGAAPGANPPAGLAAAQRIA